MADFANTVVNNQRENVSKRLISVHVTKQFVGAV
jgi:hypothetical protein